MVQSMFPAISLHVFPVGAIPYIAPEMMKYGSNVYSVDIWSAAITIYEWELKEHPFYQSPGDDDTSESGFAEQLDAFCENVEQTLVLPEKPKYLQVLKQLLQPDPVNRPSAHEALQLLQQCSSRGRLEITFHFNNSTRDLYPIQYYNFNELEQETC